jgi:hypothetical protein
MMIKKTSKYCDQLFAMITSEFIEKLDQSRAARWVSKTMLSARNLERCSQSCLLVEESSGAE